MKNWTYYYSEILGMQYAVNKNGYIMTEDKTLYSPIEVKILCKNHGEIDANIHKVKSIFEGKIIQ